MAELKILMVCLGNICRSPLAEGILRYKLANAGLNSKVDSAGTGNWHIGKPPHPLSQKVASLNKIDISYQKARQFKAEDFEHFDCIYFMDSDNYKDARHIAGAKWNPKKAFLLLDKLPNCGIKDVPDPYFGDFEGYIEVFGLISEACEIIVEDLKNFERPL